MAQPEQRPAVLYSINARLGAAGIGYIAAKAVLPIEAAGYLARLYVSSDRQSGVTTTQLRQWGWPGRGLKYLAARDSFGLVDWLGNVLYDAWVAAQLSVGDVFHVWNAHGLYSLRRARQRGLVTIVDRASSHPRTQRRLLQAERTRWNVAGNGRDWNERRAIQELVETDYVIVPSAFTRQSLSDEGIPEHKLVEIPFGVDLQRFFPAAERSVRPFRVIFVGQLALRKGVPDLLEAWRRLAWHDAELWLVGRQSDEFQGLWPRWAQLPGLQHVAHTDDVAGMLRQADVFAFPSIEEGSALVTYEALASGLPVVTTANAGSVVRDQEDGFVVPIRDQSAVCASLEQLRAKPALCRSMGAAARRRAESYPWTAYGQNLIEAYRHITAPAR